MSVSGTNAPVSVHISYQCSIGPDSPIYDVAHTPAPKPMARKVTTRRPMETVPPLPTDDSGYGDDPDPSRPTMPLSPDAAAPSHAVQLSLRSKNAGRSMVRRLGSLMGELAGELQSVRKHQSDVEA